MGRSLVLNLADHGVTVAGYDRDPAQGVALRQAAGSGVRTATTCQDLIVALARPRATFLPQLRHALHAAMIITYAQGFSLLVAASDHYHYQLDCEAVARIWRGGCIIRAALLEPVCAAFQARRALRNVLLDPAVSRTVEALQQDLRQVVCQAVGAGLPAPGMAVALAYFDAYRSAWLPANLIQAQRDNFGAHTYERIDAKGAFHTAWEKEPDA